jgi:hypothetical protein
MNFMNDNLPMSVKNNSMVTAGATNGRMRANAEAKTMARMQHDIAYTGSYTPGYTAIKKWSQLLIRTGIHSNTARPPQAVKENADRR